MRFLHKALKGFLIFLLLLVAINFVLTLTGFLFVLVGTGGPAFGYHANPSLVALGEKLLYYGALNFIMYLATAFSLAIIDDLFLD